MRLILKNSFHGTECEVNCSEEEMDQEKYWENLQESAYFGDKNATRQIARIKEKLCGRENCTCGVIR